MQKFECIKCGLAKLATVYKDATDGGASQICPNCGGVMVIKGNSSEELIEVPWTKTKKHDFVIK